LFQLNPRQQSEDLLAGCARGEMLLNGASVPSGERTRRPGGDCLRVGAGVGRLRGGSFRQECAPEELVYRIVALAASVHDALT
jgi:hypothetical protein